MKMDSNWIKIEEGCEMPEEDQYVCFITGSGVRRGYHIVGNMFEYNTGLLTTQRCLATHWMPDNLPSPPTAS